MEKTYRPWYERMESGKRLDYGTTDKNYADFYATKPKDWRVKSVGKTREEMISSGLIKFEDLADLRTGRQYTIRELKQKHS